MLDIQFIRDHADLVKAGVEHKGVDPKLVDKFIHVDEEWRGKTKIIDELQAEQNTLSKELAKGTKDDLVSKATIVKTRLGQLAEEEAALAAKRADLLGKLPNLPAVGVPLGPDESGNRVLREVGDRPTVSFEPKGYLTLGEELGLIDVKRAAKVSGSRFGYLLREAALMELGLQRLALDTLLPHGFTPVIPPVFVKDTMMQAMGYLDRHEDAEETYCFEKDKLYLVGTSEQSVGPFHAGDVLRETELPKRYLSFSTCFRREAGSYGKDTKGIFRVHQFDKAELFSFCVPEQSEEEHRFLLSLEEELMQQLELPYRVVEMCTGDLGNVAAAKYDIEAWFPSQRAYRETHSTSNCTDYQARRLNVKYRPNAKGEKPRLVHTVNGTAFSQRPILAILENNQTEVGMVKVPKVLQGYVGKKEIG